ncbi:MAG TPA: hypothetical protein VE781_01620 [Kineosporiaceae bacterium]|nr:hypothetical protein [Kineosporiaceae bacterium]
MALRRPRRAGPTAASTWASALDRYRRAVARYSESLRTMPERQLRSDLTDLAGPLEAVLEDFEDAAAQRAGYDEAGAAAVLGCVHRAATLCSHATEAAQMANQAAWRADADDVARCLDTVRVLVKKIDELGDEVRPRR